MAAVHRQRCTTLPAYTFESREIDNEARIKQGELDICTGLVFEATVFDAKSGGQKLLFLVAHHLVVDLLSRRVILHDLEELLRYGTLSSKSPFSFWKSCELQAEKSHQITSPAVLPDGITLADMDYRELHGQPNDLGDAIEKHFQWSSQQIICSSSTVAKSCMLGLWMYSLPPLYNRSVESSRIELHQRSAARKTVVKRGTKNSTSQGPWDGAIR